MDALYAARPAALAVVLSLACLPIIVRTASASGWSSRAMASKASSGFSSPLTRLNSAKSKGNVS